MFGRDGIEVAAPMLKVFKNRNLLAENVTDRGKSITIAHHSSRPNAFCLH